MIRLENSNPKKCGDSTRGILYTCYNSITTIRRASQQMAGGWVVFLWLLRQWCNVQSYHQGQVKLVVYFLPHPHPPQKKKDTPPSWTEKYPPLYFSRPFRVSPKVICFRRLEISPLFSVGRWCFRQPFPQVPRHVPLGVQVVTLMQAWVASDRWWPTQGEGNSPWFKINSTQGGI